VVEPHEYAQNFPKYIADPPSRKRNAWSYIDARDLGQICDLCLHKDGLGFEVSLAAIHYAPRLGDPYHCLSFAPHGNMLMWQVFNATNSYISLPNVKTTDFLKKECPNVKIKREMGDDEAPLSNRKIREVLGFKDEHDWKKYTPLK
jgi:hypothetical protein